MTTNMFADIAKKTTTKKTKTNDKLSINIPGDEFNANLKAFVQLSKQEKEIKTQLSMVKGYIKEVSLNKWYSLYKINGSYPGSVIVTNDSEDSYMFAPSDKYITLNEDRAKELTDKYGDDIVTEDIVFSFKTDLLMKYAEVLTGLIQNSPDIEDNDKSNLIVAKKSISVSKGSIEKALTIGGGDVEDFLSDIQPIYMMKTAKLKG